MTTKTKNNLLTQLINNNTENYWAVSEAFNPFRDNIFDKAAEKLEDFTLKSMNSGANHLVNLLSKEGRLSNKMVAVVRHHAKQARNLDKLMADHIKNKTKEVGKNRYNPDKDKLLKEYQQHKGYHLQRINVARTFIKRHRSIFSDDVLNIAQNPGELESRDPETGKKNKPEKAEAPKALTKEQEADVKKYLGVVKDHAEKFANAKDFGDDSLQQVLTIDARDVDSMVPGQGDYQKKKLDRYRDKLDRQAGRARAPQSGGGDE